MRAVIATSAVVLVAACGAMSVATQSSAYQQGWEEGCTSGLYERNEFFGTPLASDRFERDDKRFETDSEYARGWNEGRESCASGRPTPSRRGS
jgi:hypothetical protein